MGGIGDSGHNNATFPQDFFYCSVKEQGINYKISSISEEIYFFFTVLIVLVGMVN